MAREIARGINTIGQSDFYVTAAELSADCRLDESTVSTLARRERRFEQAAYHIVKRSFDFVTALVGCICTLPVIVVVKIGNMATGDFKPMFLKQERLGKDGKVFKLIKFRSMVMLDDGRQADALLNELFKKQPELRKEYEKNHKLDNDPRITKMGKLIRATSIDELPQFFNILLGDMSLIGNRPYMVSEGGHMGKQKNTILSVKPGLTGWWQVCGRNNLTFGQRLVLEAEYGEKASFGFDMKILFKTFKAVLKKVGSK